MPRTLTPTIDAPPADKPQPWRYARGRKRARLIRRAHGETAGSKDSPRPREMAVLADLRRWQNLYFLWIDPRCRQEGVSAAVEDF